eukprot:353928-Chlamydomonas_euryale.AAC.3
MDGYVSCAGYRIRSGAVLASPDPLPLQDASSVWDKRDAWGRFPPRQIHFLCRTRLLCGINDTQRGGFGMGLTRRASSADVCAPYGSVWGERQGGTHADLAPGLACRPRPPFCMQTSSPVWHADLAPGFACRPRPRFGMQTSALVSHADLDPGLACRPRGRSPLS